MNKGNIDTVIIVIDPCAERGLFREVQCIHAQFDYSDVAFSAKRPGAARGRARGGLFYNGRETRARSLSSPQRIICLDLVGSILSSYCFATGGYLLWRGFVGVHFPPG